MTVYKLTYFNLRALAEPIRFLFALGEVEYEDVRIEYDENWPSKKKELILPFNQMPTLSVDGVVFCQSFSICRFLAERFGYAGKTDLDKLKADMIAHCCDDFRRALYPVFLENDETKKAELVAKFRAEQLTTFVTNFDKFLKENNGGDGFFVGDSITWADVVFYNFLYLINIRTNLDLFTLFQTSYPKLKALLERIEKVPQIAAWIAKRPDNKF